MLIGEYRHTLDEKRRIALPAKFRRALGKKVIITPGLDQCLFIFTTKEWQKISERLGSSKTDLSFLKRDQRSFNRNMFGQAVDVEVDSIGRVLIPDFLKDKIKLGSHAALVGVKDRVEVWNDKAWSRYKEVAEKQAEQLAEKLANKENF